MTNGMDYPIKLWDLWVLEKKFWLQSNCKKNQKKTTTSNTTSNEDKPCMLFYSFTEKLIVSSSH